MLPILLDLICVFILMATSYHWGRKSGYREGIHFGYRKGHNACLLHQQLLRRAVKEEPTDLL